MSKVRVTHPVDHTTCRHKFLDFVGHVYAGQAQRYYCLVCDSLWFVSRASPWWKTGNERPQGRADQ